LREWEELGKIASEESKAPETKVANVIKAISIT